jgi:hypothetical protein
MTPSAIARVPMTTPPFQPMAIFAIAAGAAAATAEAIDGAGADMSAVGGWAALDWLTA